jgi:hypothetical protein
MSISAKNVNFDETTMWVELSDARIIGVPLAWFPRLLNATDQERARYELSARGSIGMRWMKIFLLKAC